jgi:hypothetical protein
VRRGGVRIEDLSMSLRLLSTSLMCLVLGGCSSTFELGTNDGGPHPGSTTPSGTGESGEKDEPDEGGDRAEGGDGGDGGFVDPAECEDECSNAAVLGCCVDGFAADSECQELCAKSPTATELQCLEDAPCTTLLAALATGGAICGIPASPDGSTAQCEAYCTSAFYELSDTTSCYLPSSPNPECMALCARSPSGTQIACFKNISCVNFVDALDGGDPCGSPRADGGP